PEILGRVHPERRTPYVAIVTSSAIGLGMGLVSNFGQLATFGAIARLGIYIASCAALPALRKQRGLPEGFRAPGGPALAAIGMLFCLWMLTTRSLAEAWFLPIIIAVGGLVWVALRGRRAAAADRVMPLDG